MRPVQWSEEIAWLIRERIILTTRDAIDSVEVHEPAQDGDREAPT